MASPAPEFPIVTTRADLQRRLAEWPDDAADSTWALTFVSVYPTGGELEAIRQAAKLCDRVVTARLVPDRVMPPTLPGVAQQAGADILWCPRAVTGWLRTDAAVEGITSEVSTLMLQAITTTLPALIVAPRENIALIRALRNIQESLGDLFTLRVVQNK